MLPRKNTRDIFPFWESDILLRNAIFERQKQAQRTDIDEASVRKAVSGIGADICEGRPIEEYKKLFSAFVERVDVFEDYVTIVLKVFDRINVRVCNGSGMIKEEPPLDLHQMVVWNGGAEGNRFAFSFPWGNEKKGLAAVQPVASGAHSRRILEWFDPPGANMQKTTPMAWFLHGNS